MALMSPDRRLGSALLLLLGGLAGGFAAPDSVLAAAQHKAISGLEAAELLMQAGRLEEAKRVLAVLEKAAPGDAQVQFLVGMIAVQERDYSRAIARFRRILVGQPGLARVRLELARAFYLAKDYDNAERQFRFARAGDLSEAVKARIDIYLAAIRQARTLTYSGSLAVVPDTNINAGPSLSSVTLYGLPFQLAPGARASSGVGFAADGSFDWSPHPGNTLRFRLGGQLDTLDYPNHQFDDTSLGGYAGPRLLFKRLDISLLATMFQRWYGDRPYNTGVGVSIPVLYTLTPRLGLTGSLSALSMRYDMPPGQNGLARSASLGLVSTLNTATQASLVASVTRQDAAVNAYAYTARQVQFTGSRDLPWGFTVAISPAYMTLHYDGGLAAFGQPRRDTQWRIGTTLLNRRIDLSGFTPRVSYTHTDNRSDLAFYAYHRDQWMIGLTRAF